MAKTTPPKPLAAKHPAPPALAIEDMLPDPPPFMDMRAEPHYTEIRSILHVRYAGDPSVLVAGNGYLLFNRSGSGPRLVPDCMVAFGVDAAAALNTNAYVIDEVGKPPDFVLEVATVSTTRLEYRGKPRVCEAMKVPEYWRFDYTGGEFYDAPLAGDTLSENGLYVPIETREDAEGRTWAYSPALCLALYWDNGRLRFFDPQAGEFLLNHAETEAEIARLRAEAETARLREARLAEREGWLDERNARLAAEAEGARLRQLLNKRRNGGE